MHFTQVGRTDHSGGSDPLDASSARQSSFAGPAHNLLVGKRFDSNGVLEQAPEEQTTMARTPAIEAESELVQVVIDVVEARRTLMRSEQPALEQGDDQMNAWQELGGSRLAAAAEDDGLVVVASHAEVQVAEVAVGMNQAAALDDCFDEALHAAGGSVGESLHANSAQAPASFLDRDYDLRLCGCLTAEDARLDPTNPGLVDLDDSLQEVAVGPDHGMAQLMEPGPGGAVAAQAENLLDGHRASALLLRRDQPDGVEPDPERLVRVLKNGPGRDGGLVPALGTLEESSSARLPGSFTSAPGTDEAARPAQPSEVLPAAGLGGEAVRELGEGARIVLDDRQAISNSNLSQVHGQIKKRCC